MKKGLFSLVALAMISSSVLLVGCQRDADVASRNISYAADNFQVDRRIIFYNGITDTYILAVTGKCSIGNDSNSSEMSVTCKVGPSAYKKHFLGRADNVTYFAEQLETSDVSAYHYEVVFKPQSILPDIDFKGDASELTKNRN